MTIERRASPFDSVRNEDPELGEYWYARELMLLMGYSLWRHFNTAISRARTSMSQDGRYEVKEHFRIVKRPAQVSVGKTTETPDQGGRPSVDFRLTRPACYFIAMNGDPKKHQVAMAQQYFVLQTMTMEDVQKAMSAPLAPQGMPSHIEALRGWADALEGQQRAEEAARLAQAEAEELRPPAEAWRALAAAGGDCSIAEAAAILNRDPGITTGPHRLARWIREMRVVYERPGGPVTPYYEHQDHVRLRPTASGSEVRITPSGLVWIQQRLRQQQNRPALSVVADALAEVVPIRKS